MTFLKGSDACCPVTSAQDPSLHHFPTSPELIPLLLTRLREYMFHLARFLKPRNPDLSRPVHPQFRGISGPFLPK